MDIIYYKYWVLLLIPLSIVVGYLSIKGIGEELPDEQRDYLDPVPKSLRRIWPLVNFYAYYFGERLSVEWIVRYQKSLAKAGLNYMMSPSQYFGLQLTGATLMALVTGFCCYMLEVSGYGYPLVGAILGFFMPFLSVNDVRKRREKELVRALPVYLDFLTMATQAGLNITGAVMQAVDKGPESPMKLEFKKYLRDLRAGMARDEALRVMAERLELSEINAFVSAVIQAEKTGASVGSTLKIQSDQRRTERFQKAEKLALEAPVKLIFPLVAFIFPTTFIIIFFPIGMKLMEAF